ncbi:MAG: D-alanyl-D-alanine carboxypeptidase [Chloroflexi bacterium]|nr:D-alanyl-D-alanine carboxypeptidase [Chloroflexota bacterium]
MPRTPSQTSKPILLLLVLLSLLSTGFGPPVLTNGDASRRRLAPHQVRAMRQTPPPELTAPAYILADDITGEILLAKNEHERRSPASMTKLVTALVALERARQDMEVVIEARDVRVYSVMYLKKGEELSLRQLLFMLLIPSDNAAANAIARAVGGDVATFVGWMNEYVARLGLKDTHFANPHGYDDPQNYSTAFDMAVIGRQAMRNAVIADIVRRPQAIAAWRELDSTNELLSTYPGAIGIKTGTTDEAGECLAALVDRPAGRALSVVMGSKDRFYDTRLLLDYYYNNFAELHVDLPDTHQNRYQDLEHNWHSFWLRQPLTILVKPWQVDTVSMYRRIDNTDPNPDPERPIGALIVSLDGGVLTEVPLYVRPTR